MALTKFLELTPDMFAAWAFSADGILGLQVIAFGDFSYNCRFSNCVLFYKSQTGHQKVTTDDEQFWEHRQRMLGVCPLEKVDYQVTHCVADPTLCDDEGRTRCTPVSRYL
jgi:hypothetical protein